MCVSRGIAAARYRAIDVHIVCLVESVVRDGRQQERKPPQ